MSGARLPEILREARRSESEPPPFGSVLTRTSSRRRLRAGLAGSAAVAAGLTLAVFIAVPRDGGDAALPLEIAPPDPPPSTDWLAEPLGADLLATVPTLIPTGADHADF